MSQLPIGTLTLLEDDGSWASPVYGIAHWVLSMAVVAVMTSLMQVIIYIADGLMVRALVLCSVSPFWLREDGLLAFIDLSMLHCHL